VPASSRKNYAEDEVVDHGSGTEEEASLDVCGR
jgi:hypothetical protein